MRTSPFRNLRQRSKRHTVSTSRSPSNFATDEQLRQMRDQGIFLVLTHTWYGGCFLKINSSQSL
jgi:hypothetical protein